MAKRGLRRFLSRGGEEEGRELGQGPSAGDGVFVEAGVSKVVRAAGFGGGAGGQEDFGDVLAASQGMVGELESAGGHGGDVLPLGDRRRRSPEVLSVSSKRSIPLELVGKDLERQFIEAGWSRLGDEAIEVLNETWIGFEAFVGKHFSMGGGLTRWKKIAMSLSVVNWQHNNAISPNSTDLKVMFSLKNLIGLVLTSLLLASCTPFPPYQGVPNPNGQQVAAPVEATKTVVELKEEEDLRKARVKANAEAKARRDALREQKDEATGGGSAGGDDVIQPIKRNPVKRPSKYRTAMAIPGKPGFVFNPWTNKAVDVRGIPSKQLIRDPNDGNSDHKFRVP
ncbi:MAG: hypothetical protein ACJAVK_000811 [Akkermansiaceae bacterium]